MNKELIKRYKQDIDKIIEKYNYDSNIKHLLYVIVPAFIHKYNEKVVLDTFKNTIIKISKDKDKYVNAYYVSTPYKYNNEIKTHKYIVINNYEQIPLVKLLDSIIHEFNHAINSYNNEYIYNDELLLLRTGLSFITYNVKTLKVIEKSPVYILEEIINTKQTEDVIDIIKNYHDEEDKEINNIVYALNNETTKKYNSEAYNFEKNLLKDLLSNKTFYSTLENLRLTGNIEDIDKWFDNITNQDKSYEQLIKYLIKIEDLAQEYTNAKLFKNRKLNQIRSIANNVKQIINTFNNNCTYK